jgi:hypothetical protein
LVVYGREARWLKPVEDVRWVEGLLKFMAEDDRKKDSENLWKMLEDGYYIANNNLCTYVITDHIKIRSPKDVTSRLREEEDKLSLLCSVD